MAGIHEGQNAQVFHNQTTRSGVVKRRLPFHARNASFSSNGTRITAAADIHACALIGIAVPQRVRKFKQQTTNRPTVINNVHRTHETIHPPAQSHTALPLTVQPFR
jgi:hypothetical protein